MELIKKILAANRLFEVEYYKVRIIVDRENLTSRQARIEIRPGMQAQAELQTGAKSVLQYLLKPLYKSKDALRER